MEDSIGKAQKVVLILTAIIGGIILLVLIMDFVYRGHLEVTNNGEIDNTYYFIGKISEVSEEYFKVKIADSGNTSAENDDIVKVSKFIVNSNIELSDMIDFGRYIDEIVVLGNLDKDVNGELRFKLVRYIGSNKDCPKFEEGQYARIELIKDINRGASSQLVPISIKKIYDYKIA